MRARRGNPSLGDWSGNPAFDERDELDILRLVLITCFMAMLSEALRPQFHFTAPKGWLNDPNGLVYENGKYHLFYQHNPQGTNWGNMTWGHAISRDLIHWSHLPNAIEPDSLGTIFSGSAVIDFENTSGFGAAGKPPMVCIYTAAGGTNEASKGQPFTQCLAWSLDGQSVNKYIGNPVVPHVAGENRDPKVFWFAPDRRWIMALYLKDDHYAILGSKNLKEWTRLSEIALPGTSECPDLFPLPLDGDGKRMKWIFWGANGNYFVGDFDGTTFHPTTPILHSHHGNTGYAAQTYSNAPKGRRIQISWFRDSNFPNCDWNQQMGLPNALSLRTTSDGPKLCFWPVDEIKKIRSKNVEAKDSYFPVPSRLIDMEGSWDVSGSEPLSLDVNGLDVKFDPLTSTLSVAGQTAVVNVPAKRLSLRIVADRTSLEIYAQHGELLMNVFSLPQFGQAGGVRVPPLAKRGSAIQVFELRP